ncbi:hypothetical protein QUF76_01575 [Desulfobacterales bacterium HSG16]|nr:hypothetical protein [Desulfobacterales bacterium HSG16]
MEIVSNIALISINETLIIQLISFLIFLFLINKIMIRPLNGTMAERAIFIETVKEEITDAGKRINKISEQIREKEQAVRKEAFEIAAEAEDTGGQKASEIFENVVREISKLRKQTEQEVDIQVTEARKYIQTESETLAATIMERILDRRL